MVDKRELELLEVEVVDIELRVEELDNVPDCVERV